MLVDLRPKGVTGKAAEQALERARHHLQQERHSVRSAEADGHLGHSPRLAGGHHARLRRRANSAKSAELIVEVLDALTARCQLRQYSHRNCRCREGRGLTARFPIYSVSGTPRADNLRTDRRAPDALPVFRQNEDTQVKDSRPTEDGARIRRRRQCDKCGQRFTTFERVQLRELMVLKRSGRRRRSIATSSRASV